MKGQIKILLLAILVSLFSINIPIYADDTDPDVYCATTSVLGGAQRLFGTSSNDGYFNGTDYSSIRLWAIELVVIESDGSETSINFSDVVSSVSDGTGWVQYELSRGTYGGTLARLKHIYLMTNLVPAEYYGKKIMIELQFGSSASKLTREQDYFVVLGAPDVEYSGSDFVYIDTDSDPYYYMTACEGDVISFEIDNSLTPYDGYTAIYSWIMSSDDGTYLNENMGQGTSVYCDYLTTGTSNGFEFTPSITFYDSDGNSYCTSSMTKFYVGYDSTIELHLELNGTETNEFTICEGDEVTLKVIGYKDQAEHAYMEGEVYYFDPETQNEVSCGTFDQGSMSIDISSVLKVVDNENTIYEFTVKGNDTSTTNDGGYGAFCEFSGSFTITVIERDATVTVSPSSSASYYCEGTTATFSYSVTGKSDYTYKWYACQVDENGAVCNSYEGGTLACSTATNNTVEGSFDVSDLKYVADDNGVIYVTFKVYNGDCLAGEGSTTITVSPLPVVEDKGNGDYELCKDAADGEGVTLSFGLTSDSYASTSDIIEYTITDADGNTYSTASSSYAASNTATSEELKPTETTIYYITAKNTTTGCESQDALAITVTVNPRPDIDNISGGNTYCYTDVQSSGVTLTAELISTYDQTNRTITYEWTYTDSNGNTGTLSETSASITVTPTATTTYSVTATDDKGCKSSAEVSTTVTVNYAGTIESTLSATEVCDGEGFSFTFDSNLFNIASEYTASVSISNSVAPSGSYSSGVYTVNDYSASGITSVTTYTYSFTFTNTTTSCDTTVEVSMVVNPIPATPVVDPSTTHLCKVGANVTFTVTNYNSAYTYKWYDMSDSQVNTGQTYTLVPSGDESYYVIAVDESTSSVTTCTSEATYVTVYVDAELVEPEITASATKFCKNDTDTSFDLTVSNASDYSTTVSDGSAVIYYSWYTEDGTALAEDQTSSTYSISSISETTSYYVVVTRVVTASDGTEYTCGSTQSDLVEVEVNVNPEATITIDDGSTTSYCDGETISIKATLDNYSDLSSHSFTYSFTKSSQNIQTNTGNTSSSLTTSYTFDEDNSAITAISFCVTITDETTNCVSTTTCQSVDVYPLLTADISADPSWEVCKGEDITIIASSYNHTNGVSSLYRYLDDTHTTSEHLTGSDNFTSYTFTPEDGYLYYYKGLNNRAYNKCEYYYELPIVLLDKPDFSISGDEEWCAGDTLELTIDKSGLDLTNYTYTYVWSKIGDTSFSQSGETMQIYGVSSSTAGSYIATCTQYSATDGSEICSGNDTITITINDLPTPSIEGDNYVCYQGTIDLWPDASYVSYAWYVGSISSSVASTAKTYSYNSEDYGDAAGSQVTILLRVTDTNTCTSKPVSKTITVKYLPEVNSVSGVEACKDGDFTLTVDAGNSNESSASIDEYYLYLASATDEGNEVSTNTSNTLTLTNSAYQSNGTDAYAVRVKDSNGCLSEPYYITLKENNSSAEFDNANPEFCSNDDSQQTLTVTYDLDENDYATPKSFEFFIDGVSYMTQGSNDNYVTLQPDQYTVGTHTLSVEITTYLGCVIEAQVDFEIHQALSDTLSYTNVCSGEEITYAAEAGGSSYEFFVNGTSQGTQTSNQFTDVLSNGDIVYAVLTTSDGCETTTQSYTVEYYDLPTVTEVANAYACKDADFSISVTASTTATGGLSTYYLYAIADTTSGNHIASSTTSTIALSNSDFQAYVSGDSGEFAVRVEDANGCLSYAYVFTLIEYESTLVLSPDNAVLCSSSDEGQTFTATLSTNEDTSSSPYSYQYSFVLYDENGNVVDNSQSGVKSCEYIIVPSNYKGQEGMYTLTASATTGYGCSVDEVSITFQIAEALDGTLTSNIPACYETQEVIVTAAAGAESYEFYVSDVSQGVSTSNVFTSTTLSKGDVIYTILRSTGCETKSNSVTVDYTDEFVVDLTYSGDYVCGDDAKTFTLTSQNYNIGSYAIYVDGSQVSVTETSVSDTEIEFTYKYTGSNTSYEIYAVATSSIDAYTDSDGNVYEPGGCEYTTATATIYASQIAITDYDTDVTTQNICVNSSYIQYVQVYGAVNGNYEVYAGPSVNKISQLSVATDRTSTSTDYVWYSYEVKGEDYGVGVPTIYFIAFDTDAFCGDTTYISGVEIMELPTIAATYEESDNHSKNTYASNGSGTISYLDTYDLCYDDGTFITEATTDADVITLTFDDVDIYQLTTSGTTTVASSVPDQLALSTALTATSSTDANGNMVTEFEFQNSRTLDLPAGTHKVKLTATNSTTNCVSDSVVFYLTYLAPIELTFAPTNLAISDETITLCQNDTTTITVSCDDASTFDIYLDGTQVVSSGNTYQYIATNIGTQELLIIADNYCQRTLTLETVEAPTATLETIQVYNEEDDIYETPTNTVNSSGIYTYEMCSGDTYYVTVNGGASSSSSFTLEVEIGSTSYDSNSVSGSEITYSNALVYDETLANGQDYTLYTFNYTVSVGSCEDYLTFYVKVYKLPEGSLTISPSTTLQGNNVTVTAPSGYSNYFFYANEVLVYEGSESTYAAALDTTTTYRVLVYNDNNCFIELTGTATILEGIDIKEVTSSAEYYCSEDEGVTITVVDPQDGITYRLVGCVSYDDIVYDASTMSGVSWSNVRVANDSTSCIYEVQAFHASLADSVYSMANTITVTEVETPTIYGLSPQITRTSCDNNDVITLSSSDKDTYYYLYLNDEIKLGPIRGTGSELTFMDSPEDIGTYTIVAYRWYKDSDGNPIEQACFTQMNGQYVIDIVEPTKFTIGIDPSNGLICVDDNQTAEITLLGSETDATYYLFLDDDIVYDANGDSVMVAGTGSEISFGTFNIAGTYTAKCKVNSCWSVMDSSVELVTYNTPSDQTLTVTNNGHFCEGEEGVYITVVTTQGAEYQYTLLRNGISYSSSFGSDTYDSIEFGPIAEEGTYTVLVDIPDITAGGCEFVLSTNITVTEDVITDAILYILDDDNNYLADVDTICEQEAVTIVISPTDENATYSLYVDGNFYDSAVADASGLIYFYDFATEGTLTLSASEDFYDTDGVTILNSCLKEFSTSVSLVVVPRPYPANETIHQTGSETDQCYGVDIVVENAQAGYTYYLYKLDDDGNRLSSAAGSFVAVNDTAYDRFNDIRAKNSNYKIYISNGYCEEEYSEVINVQSDKYVTDQTIIAVTSICQGDAGGTVTLADTEDGVTYTLYDSDGNELEVYDATSTGTYTFSYLLVDAGTYYVMGKYTNVADACESQIDSDIEFTIYELPASYQLLGQDSYCASSTGVEITLSSSDLGVTYYLYENVNGSLKRVTSAQGTGSTLSFGTYDEGTYTASAISTSGCTSSMMGTLVVTYKQEITSDNIVESTTVCGGEAYDYTYPSPVVDVTYHLMSSSATPGDETPLYSYKYDGVTDIVFTMSTAGTYYIYASYDDYACPQLMGTFELSVNTLTPFNVTSNQDDNCDGSNLEVYLEGSEVGITYYVDEISGSELTGDGSTLTWSVSGSGEQTYTIYAINSDGTCQTLMGSTTIDFDNVVNPAAEMIVYIQGEEYDLSTGIPPSVCSSSVVTFVTDVDVTVSTYTYYINGVAVSTRTGSLWIPSLSGYTDTITVSVDIETKTGCTYDSIAAVRLIITDGGIDQRLVAAGDDNEYCEGEAGVKLAYLLAETGYIYRLYRLDDDGSIELMDIQEIPSYSSEQIVDSLWFDGWGDTGGKSNIYASAGTYYVEAESDETGCSITTNTIEVIVNELPGNTSTVFYAVIDDDGNYTSTSTDFGLLGTGYMVLENAEAGVIYTLYNIDTDTNIETQTATTDGETLIFGPVMYEDSVNVGGEGLYTIIAYNPDTECSNELGSIEFVEEDLVAYDVYLYLNKNQTTVRKSLIPTYGSKGNHKYIDWSTKVDMVWLPKTESADDGSMYVTSDDSEDIYDSGTGYTSIQTSANIVFEIVDDSDTTWYTSYVEGCDSIVTSTTVVYTYTDTLGVTYESPTYCDECTETVTNKYSYFIPGETLYGKYGFYDYDTTPTTSEYSTTNLSGLFCYSKPSSFYGRETIQYRIYNSKFESMRTSNIAYITILSGNQSVDSTAVFLIPNAFSPNDDGYNDVFQILIPTEYEDASESSLEVFNRWGTLVYRSSGNQYGKDCDWWDGTSKTSNMLTVGEKCPSGTYFYVFKITFINASSGSQVTKKLNGFIELRR